MISCRTWYYQPLNEVCIRSPRSGTTLRINAVWFSHEPLLVLRPRIEEVVKSGAQHCEFSPGELRELFKRACVSGALEPVKDGLAHLATGEAEVSDSLLADSRQSGTPEHGVIRHVCGRMTRLQWCPSCMKCVVHWEQRDPRARCCICGSVFEHGAHKAT